MLRPDIEARVRAFEEAAEETGKRVDEALRRSDSICKDLDEAAESIDDGSLDGIPVETFDEPSVVEHTDVLDQAARRARRESRQLAVGGRRR